MSTELDVLKRYDSLPAKDRAQIAKLVAMKKSADRRIFYCKVGRECDGRPHAGAPFKHARGDQWPPPGVDWDVWFYMSGRGVGKTLAGGNWTRLMSRLTPRLALVGRRGTDVRATMVEGPSGLIKACEAAGEWYDWKPALKEFTFENGGKAFGYSAEEPESLRGPEHGGGWFDEPCVAEGSLVLLRRGLTPIELVQVGDEAWTRMGWKAVTAVFDNGIKETFWVEAGGRRVRVTANHRFATDNGKWLRCEDLEHDSRLVACSHMDLPRGSNGATGATTATGRGTTATVADGSSIATSTRPRWAPSRKGTTFTTLTRTRRTTTRRISRPSPLPTTIRSRSEVSLNAASTSSRTRTRLSGRLAVAPRWTRSGPSVSLGLTSAHSVGSSSRAGRRTPPTALLLTASAPVESVSPAGPARVYDLTIEDVHEFVAGGLVVHNCHMVLIEECWSNYNLGLRSEGIPGGAKTLLTSSPLPTKWTKARIAEQGDILLDEVGRPKLDEEGKVEKEPRTVLVQVPTSVNLHNLDEGYKRRVINPLKGTRKGRQELDAMLLEDVEGALWSAEWLKRDRFVIDDMDRIVVSIDPAGSDKEIADLTGMVSVGKMGDQYGVFRDLSGHYTPDGWARAAIAEYERLGADAIVAEKTFGGQMVENTLRTAGFTGKIAIGKTSAGKRLRAEPVSALYEQGQVFHLEYAELAELEDEQLTWVPAISKKSPNRVDALVHGINELSGAVVMRAGIGRASGDISRGTPSSGLAPRFNPLAGRQPFRGTLR